MKISCTFPGGYSSGSNHRFAVYLQNCIKTMKIGACPFLLLACPVNKEAAMVVSRECYHPWSQCLSLMVTSSTFRTALAEPKQDITVPDTEHPCPGDGQHHRSSEQPVLTQGLAIGLLLQTARSELHIIWSAANNRCKGSTRQLVSK